MWCWIERNDNNNTVLFTQLQIRGDSFKELNINIFPCSFWAHLMCVSLIQRHFGSVFFFFFSLFVSYSVLNQITKNTWPNYGEKWVARSAFCRISMRACGSWETISPQLLHAFGLKRPHGTHTHTQAEPLLSAVSHPIVNMSPSTKVIATDMGARWCRIFAGWLWLTDWLARLRRNEHPRLFCLCVANRNWCVCGVCWLLNEMWENL